MHNYEFNNIWIMMSVMSKGLLLGFLEDSWPLGRGPDRKVPQFERFGMGRKKRTVSTVGGQNGTVA